MRYEVDLDEDEGSILSGLLLFIASALDERWPDLWQQKMAKLIEMLEDHLASELHDD